MKQLRKFFTACILAFCVSASAANLPPYWQHDQTFQISPSGLVKISLPLTTLDSAQPELEDLRLYDEAGNEVPYVIERPMPSPKIVQRAKSFQISLGANATVITLETGLSQPLDTITLESPATKFIKAVRVDASVDGKNWKALVQGQPIFHQPYGAENLTITFPPTTTKWMRLTVDDQHSQPVPFTGVLVHAASGESAPIETTPVAISERDESPGETRLALNLPAANLGITSVQIETAEPLFMRQITFAVPQISNDTIREQVVGRGAIYRVAVQSQPSSEQLSVPFGNQVQSRELILLVKNGDSPPLSIKSIHIERRPVYLIFLAQQPGTFHLLTGNASCGPPRYDLASLNMNLKTIPLSTVQIPSPSDNPNFKVSEVLPRIEVTGTTLDTSAWKFRKPAKISGAGAQQIELDLDVLAHARPDFDDVRLMRGSNQVPYIIQHTSISRPLAISATSTNDAKTPSINRWIIKLPQSNLPLTRLTCVSQTPLFQRSLSLYEELTDERGEVYRHSLGSASWTQTPDYKSGDFTLSFDGSPQSDTLFLETDNGDNPPIELEKFTVVYPVTRILFKAKPNDEIFLYYGNPDASSPSYDLSLVANQLLAANKQSASLGNEQQLRESSRHEKEIPGKGGMLFWGILGLVVVVLLAIISRLLPKAKN